MSSPFVAGSRGPLGGESHRPIVDTGTVNRQQNRPPGPSCSASPLFSLTAHMLLGGVHVVMDEYAQEIFDLWFSGKALGDVVIDNDKWANYMRADPGLERHIVNTLRTHACADEVRGPLDAGQSRHEGVFSLGTQAEVGDSYGGYATGYAVLHGSNKTVGGFQISGRFSAERAGPAGSPYTVAYSELAYVFNDLVDINKKYKADVQFGVLAANMARCLGGLPPRDFTLRIKWRDKATRRVSIGGPGFLPEFRKL
ncbi:hypothetical protein OOT46_11550 [Aquabacterium sp. A7-Y]|uniref:hypothetical protein n=1 Tax=Aquabacterium sp. A7-Y TaxID=1349605 RepID=UPI00223C9409|nr:hypothetical protein [Aquabacterium sp. A7-Y]MCW7538475.1 hypothetical protein [Aquabacterium sp. A7-Y]